MNLTYKILWIEDESDFIDSFDVDALARYIEDQGFDPDIEFRMTPDDIKKEVDGRNYDLLIVDYNITEDNFHGSDLIRQVRDTNCLTEVIFYSQDPTQLRNIAATQKLEGVFFSGRDRDQLPRKIQDVFNLTVRKVVDVDNMRGIVMSGVAEVDHLVSDVIRAIHRNLDEGKQTELCKRLLKKMRPVVKHLRALVKDTDHPHFTEVEKLIDAVVDLDPAEFETLLGARSFDSSKRVDMVVSLSKDHAHLKEHKESINSVKDLLLWRNALAHQKEKGSDANGFPIFEPREGQEQSFDNATTLKLRQQLREHRKRLTTILSSLTPMEALMSAGAGRESLNETQTKKASALGPSKKMVSLRS